jgi:hypothetical protein
MSEILCLLLLKIFKQKIFLPACTYVQRGSKFCFVVVLVVLGDTLIKLQWQDTKLQWQDTKLQWQDTKLQWQDTKLQSQDTKLHARCAMSRSGRSPNCVTGHQTAWQVTKKRARSAMSCSGRSPNCARAIVKTSLNFHHDNGAYCTLAM